MKPNVFRSSCPSSPRSGRRPTHPWSRCARWLASLCLALLSFGSAQAQALVPVVAYQSGGWRYLQVTTGDLAGFEKGAEPAGFADGTASFGTGGGCPLDATVQTQWDSSTDLLLRRTLSFPNGAQGVEVGVAVDNDVQVWFNGVDISGGLRASGGCATLDGFVFPVPNTLILAGDNLLAVRARDEGGIALVDVRVSAAALSFAPCLTAPAGLVATWNGNADGYDLVGGNQGQLLSGASSVAGKVGNAFRFDGSTGFFQAPDSPLWAFGLNDFSIELWANFAAADGNHSFLASDDGGGAQSKWIFWLSGGNLVFHLNGAGGLRDIGRVPFNPVLGRWYHLAVTRSGAAYTFYINGTAAGTDSDTNPVPDASAPLTIGRAEGNFYFEGLLDEVSIYHETISAADVAAIYNAGGAGKCTSGTVAFNETFESYASGTLLSDTGWTMSCNAAGCGAVRITDQTALGSGNHAVDGSTGTGRGGYIGAHKAFGTAVSPGDRLTLSARLYTYADQNLVWVGLYNGHDGSTGDPEGIALDATGGAEHGFGLRLQRLGQELGGVHFGPPLMTGVYGVKIQVDGARQVLWAEIVPPTGAAYASPVLPLNGQPVEELQGIQLYVKNFGAPNTGDIDDLRVLLNDPMLPPCTPSPAGLVAWLPGNGNANDVIGGHNGQIQGGAAYDVAEVGQGFRFDSDADRVVIPDGDDLNIHPAGFTVEFWLRGGKNQPDPQYLVVDKSHGFSDNAGWAMQGNSRSGTISWAIGSTTDYFPSVTSTTDVLDGGFHHIAGTWSGGTMRLYVDGLEQGNGTVATPLNNTREMHLGYSYGGGTPQRFFRGLLDEVSVYQRALSDTEVAAIYQAGGAGKCRPPTCVPPPAGLVLWLPGDSDATDRVGGHSGTLFNGASFAPGKVGTAFRFDGNDDTVQVPDAPALRPQRFTVEAWVFAHSAGGFSACCADAQGGVVISKDVTGTEAGNGASYGLLGPGTGGLFNANVRFTDATQPSPFSVNPVAFNTWHHVAMSWDGDTVRLYVDGNLENSQVVGPKTVAYSAQPLGIGRHSAFDGGRGFDGLIDEPTLYDRALSTAEIQAIYAADSAGKCRPQFADLAVAAQSAPSSAGLGQVSHFTTTVTNAGPGTASGTLLTMTPTAGLRVLANVDPRFTVAADHAVCNLGTIAVGASITVAYDVMATRAGDSSLVASVTGDLSDPLPVNNSFTSRVTITGAQKVLFVNVAGPYDSDGQNYFQTLLNAGVDATFVQQDHNGAVFDALAAGSYDQIWVYDLSSGFDAYPDDWPAIANWFAARPQAQIICDGRIISSYWFGRYLGEGQSLTENYFLNLSSRGGGLVLGTDDNNFHTSGMNDLTAALNLQPFSGNFGLSLIPVDTANPLMTQPNDLGANLYDDSSPSQTPYGLQPNGRILYTVARHGDDANTPGISSTISGSVGLRVAITAPLANAVIGEGAPVTLHATASGGPEPVTFTWRSDRVADPLGTGADLIVPRLPIGAQTLTVLATDAGGGADSASIRITVNPLPDLVVTDVNVPATALAGQPVQVSWTVQNQGTVATSGGWTETLALSDDNAVGGDLGLTSVNIKTGLAAGESATHRATVLLPATHAGSRFLVVTTDSANQVTESDETNNSRSAAQPTQLNAADLVVDGVTVRAPAAGANLVVNGDFEEPVIAPGSFVTLSPGDSGLGSWRIVGDRLAFGSMGNIYGITASSGSQLVDLTGFDNELPHGSVTQTILTGPGREYVLSFDLGVVVGVPSYDGPITVQAQAGAAGGTFTHSPAGSGNVWGTYSLPFTATAATTEITLTGISGVSYIGLDNVAVRETGAGNGQLVAGGPAEISWTVRNAGTAPANAVWTDRLILNAAGGDHTLPSVYAADPSPLAAGASYTRTAIVTLPLAAGLAGGSFTVSVTTDVEGTQAESNEGNNTTASATFTLPPVPLPDLVVTSLIAPAQASPDSPFELIWTVRNAGSAAATGAWDEVVTLNTDAGDGARLLTVPVAGPLLPGASVTRTNLVRVPTTAGGAVRFTLTTDAGNALLESNDANNTLRSDPATTVPVSLSLTLPVSEVPENLVPPLLHGRVLRSGPSAAGLMVTLASSDLTGATVPASIMIPAGSGAADFEVTIIADGIVTGPKNLTLSAHADGVGDGSVSLTVLNTDQPTLALKLDAASVVEGQSVPAHIVRSALTDGDLTVSLQASASGLLLPPTVTIPAGQASVAFAVVADDNTRLDPPRDLILTARAPAFAPASAGLRLLDNDDPGLVLAVDNPRFSEAAGGLAATATITRQGALDRSLVVQLGASDPAKVSLLPTVVIPAGKGSALFYLTAVNNTVVDGDKDVTISASVVDASGLTLAQAAPIHITVTDDDGPALRLLLTGTLVREDHTLAGRVARNTDPAAALTVALTSSDTGHATVPGSVVIPAGATAADFLINGVDDHQATGNHQVTIAANAAGFSGAAAPLTVTDSDLPDLLITEVTTPDSGLAGDFFSVSYRLANQGVDTARGPFTQKVFISKDAFLDAGDKQLDATVYVDALPPGTSVRRTFTFFLPHETGDYWIFVVADSGNAVNETLENNNTAVSASPIHVLPAYSATVATDVTVAPAGTPIPLHGHATRADGGPAQFEAVSLQIAVRGTKRVIAALTDDAGDFRTVFKPLPQEAGHYEVGASYPGVANPPGQARFSILGLRFNTDGAFVKLMPNGSAVSQAELENIGDDPVANLAATVSAGTGIDVQVAAPAELAAHAKVNVTITSRALTDRNAVGAFTVHVANAAGVAADFPVDYSVELPVPRLEVKPQSLSGGMLRNAQTIVEFTVANVGGAATGPLDLILPEAKWLRTSTPSPLPPLAPGDTAKVTLQLLPDDSLPLGPYSGTLAVGNDTVRVGVPFAFRHVSDAVGDVKVGAVDEVTYYGGQGVKVAGALVTLRDVYTSETRASGVTAIDGTLLLPNLPEGSYNLEVSAPRHDTYQQTIQVMPGKVTEQLAFLRTQLVRYSWKVEEIDIEEKATIRLETVFETVVPTPVLTVDPNLVDLTGVTADELQVTLKVTNQGLIAAQNVILHFEDGGRWSITPLADNFGALPAKSSIEIPVLFKRLPKPVGIPTDADCRLPSLGIQWSLICGPFAVDYWVPVPVLDTNPCRPVAQPAGDGPPSFVDVFPPLPGPAHRGGIGGGAGLGGGGYIPVGVGGNTGVTYQHTNTCNCTQNSFLEHSVPAEIGYKAELSQAVKETLAEALAPLGFATVSSFEFNLDGSGKLSTCCSETGGLGNIGLRLDGQSGGEITARVVLGPRVKFSQNLTLPGFTSATGEFAVDGSTEVTVAGSATLSATTECLLENPKVCLDSKIAAKLQVGVNGTVKVTAITADGQTVTGDGKVSGTIDTAAAATLSGCFVGGPALQRIACFNDVIANVAGAVSFPGGVQLNVTAATTLQPGACRTNATVRTAGFMALAETQPSATSIARLLGLGSPAALAAAVTGHADAGLKLGPDATGHQLSDAILAAMPARPRPARGESPVIFEHSLAPVAPPAVAAAKSAKHPRPAGAPRKAGEDQGICAQVKLLIEQQAVVTRKAIGATLEIENQDDTNPLENLGVTIQIYDHAGNLQNDKFVILDPVVTRLQPMDIPPAGKVILGGKPFRLAAATTGSARWVILPKDGAAPDEPVEYRVGGFMTYTVGGVPNTAEFTPGPVRVYPNAKLYLKYFHQRDVFSDDPFTPQIEPSEPYVLGVMVVNHGKGVARNFSITSAQPKIVENLRGLLIDFNIIATEVSGKSLTPSLTADFGDVGPGETAIGRWLLKSSLQGLFVDYSATLEHSDQFGQRGASVFEGVEIHELIHQVEAGGTFADGKPDFLVNDVPDEDDLPDTLHFSDGTSTAPVTVVRDSGVSGPVDNDHLVVQLTAPLPQSWAYLLVPDPGNGTFRLTGVKRSDGTSVPVGVNAWVTDRTFLGLGRKPRYENMLHLLDYQSTGAYMLTYTRSVTAPDTTAPSSSVAALPDLSPAQIPVRWSGQDGALGSGIASYDIFVSVDGGPFTPWQFATRNTAGFYPGAAGHRYAFYSIARDAAGNAEPAPSAPEAVTTATGNSAPNLTAPPDTTIDEGQAFAATATASDADLPGDTLTFTLVNAPPAMQIDPASGRLTWTTGELDGPATYPVTVRVTDNGTPPRSSDGTFNVTVREVNLAPALTLPGSTFTVNEGEPFTFLATASDPDLPANPLRYRLAAGAPTGAAMDAGSGLFSWTPAEFQGGAAYQITVEVTDQGAPELTARANFSVTVNKLNSPPTLARVKNASVIEGDTLTINSRATDPDLPVQPLTFTLDAGGVAGPAVDAASGSFTWTPEAAQAPGTNQFTLTVADNGVPPLAASQTFSVTVLPVRPGLNYPMRSANGDVSFHFKGEVGRRYLFEASVDLIHWELLQEFNATVPRFILTDHTSTAFNNRFFRARPDN